MLGWKSREGKIDDALRGAFVATSQQIHGVFAPFPGADRMEIDIFVVSAITTFILNWSDQRGKVPPAEADRFCKAMIGALSKASTRPMGALSTMLQTRFAEYRPLIMQSFSTAQGNGGGFLMLALDNHALKDLPDEIPMRGNLLENAITHAAATVKKAYA